MAVRFMSSRWRGRGKSTALSVLIAVMFQRGKAALKGRCRALLRWRFTSSLLILLIVILSGCDSKGAIEQPQSLAFENVVVPIRDIIEKGELVVVTRNAPTTYYEGRAGAEGFEYDFVRDYARDLGVEARFIVAPGVSEMLELMSSGEVDLAAAGLTRTPAREKHLYFGPAYQTVRQHVVCRRGNKVPSSIEALKDVVLTVGLNTSYEENLIKLKQIHPGLTWKTSESLSTEQLLEQVWRRKTDCTIADSNIVAINRRYFPELLVAFPISEEQPLAWILPDNAKALHNHISNWLVRYKHSGRLAALYERHYGHVEIFDYVDINVFKRRISNRLPQYQNMFKSAANRYKLPWTLIAAQAYQESHWDPEARSPTGVRGLMMLTRRTAKDLGVEDRMDPKQSINGGTRYLAKLLRRLPAEIEDVDRMWFALAAYNVGYGHVMDARKLAVQLGKNPNAWHDVKEVLPLLSQKRYYRHLKYGYARGYEPVRYVQRIREFQDILEQRNQTVQNRKKGGSNS